MALVGAFGVRCIGPPVLFAVCVLLSSCAPMSLSVVYFVAWQTPAHFYDGHIPTLLSLVPLRFGEVTGHLCGEVRYQLVDASVLRIDA